MANMVDETRRDNPEISEDIKSLAKEVMTKSCIGDTGNNFARYSLHVDEPELWPKIRCFQTYEEYIGDKYGSRPGLPEEIIAISDTDFIQRYNELAQKGNAIIGEGITSREQADSLDALSREARTMIREYCEKLP